MEITINGKLAALKEGTSFEFIADNRLFSGSDGYSLTITFPLRGCSRNIAIFGNIHRADVVPGKLLFDCQIRDRDFVMHGSITITEITDDEVKTQFLEGRSEANFESSFADIFINELDLGAPSVTSPSAVSPSSAWSSGVYSTTFVALPWVNSQSGNIQNCTKYSAGVYSWHEDTKGLSWQPYLLYIAKKICEAVGYSCDFSAWLDKEEHRYLLVCNTLPWAWGMPQFAAALPHWSVEEFFSKLELFLEAEFDIDHRAKHIAFRYTKDYLASLAPVYLDNIIDEHSVSVAVEDENCDYVEAKNLAYTQCSHEMWKFYSCDWFIKARKGAAVEYATLNALLQSCRGFATWDGSTHRGSTLDKLFYVKDLDIYFVVRAVEKVLVEERANLPNIYSYRCILQPVNLFGARIVDVRADADETLMEFVPAWIDYTDSTFGRCLFLDFEGYDNSGSESSASNVGGSYMQNYKEMMDGTFFQPLAVQTLEMGEKEKLSQYYDKIYVGWWDGAVAQQGKLPFPYTDDVVISDDWSGYFRPHTSLRINDGKRNEQRGVYAIDTKRKASFRFLSDSIPNPRALFVIRGKRYVCEKLTATFTENGMSQLIKGEFWPCID